MGAQIMSPVHFDTSIVRLIEGGACSFVEVGFGGVLVNLVKRIDRGSERAKTGTIEEFNAFLAVGEESDE